MVEFKFSIGDEVYHGRTGIGGYVIGLYQNRTGALVSEIEYVTENGSVQTMWWPESELELM
jgi:hypothetical protein